MVARQQLAELHRWGVDPIHREDDGVLSRAAILFWLLFQLLTVFDLSSFLPRPNLTELSILLVSPSPSFPSAVVRRLYVRHQAAEEGHLRAKLCVNRPCKLPPFLGGTCTG